MILAYGTIVSGTRERSRRAHDRRDVSRDDEVDSGRDL
jgi:hypothetical protein